MAGPSWLIDSKRIATKIKNASETVDPGRVQWKSNPTKACPRCNYILDNSDVVQEWPGLPKGVKFDPSDQELLLHLISKVGNGGARPHPFINEFIPSVDEDDGICYTHPQKLPGVKLDGSMSHFFHRTFRAYNTGTRKRRKIHNGDGDVRWHKTGKTKPVIIEGKHLGCKKIMVLYVSRAKGGRPEKTNWVMHQYHLGTGEDEKDGEYVVSKIFYQQPKLGDKSEQELPLEPVEVEADIAEVGPAPVPVEELVTEIVALPVPILVTHNIHADEHHEVLNPVQRICQENTDNETGDENCANSEWGKLDQDNHHTDDTKWWEGESQFLLDSQQLAEGIAICDEFLQSQSSCGGDEVKDGPRLSDYAHIGVEDLKKDLEECQNLNTCDHTNLELDTPPDMRLSQLEFGSQDSFLAWAGSKLAD